MASQIEEVKGATGGLEDLEEEILSYNDNQCEIPNKEKHLEDLQKCAFFQLHVHLKRGVDLTVQDVSGSSDPFVKFRINNKTVHKSKIVTKDLNPLWDESFTLSIGDVFKPVVIKVYDYNRVIKDDFMGMADLEMTNLELNKLTKITLILYDPDRSTGNLGKLLLSVTLEPKSYEEKEEFIQKVETPITAEPEKIKRKVTISKSIDSIFIRNSVTPTMNLHEEVERKVSCTTSNVIIRLIKGENLRPMDPCGSSDPYAKFRLGTQSHKCRSKIKTLAPRWLEEFKLNLSSNQSHDLEVTLHDKNILKRDDFMGRCNVDLSQLQHELTHRLWLNIEEGTGRIFVLITITGRTGDDTIEDLNNYREDRYANEVIAKKYAWTRTFRDIKDVGFLQVKVFRAQGLSAEDFGGTSNPFCVLELVNSRLQTQTVYRTLSPEWKKIFHFNVKDIHSCLEVTVLDDDGDSSRPDFLGKIAIPLLRIKNGEKKWYVLKDKSLRFKAKGHFPEILLECSVQWNMVRASARSLTPREDKFMEEEGKRFRTAKLNRNIARLKPYIRDVINLGKYFRSVWRWESNSRSFMAYVIFLLATYFFELYMLPLLLVFLFLKNSWVLFVSKKGFIDDHVDDFTEESQNEDENEGQRSRSTLEWISVINQYIQIEKLMFMVQEFSGNLASVLESFSNTFYFCVPFMTWMLVMLLAVVTIVLYLIPVRYLIIILGIYSFINKLVKPHPVQHVASTRAKNAVYGFLTRVPDNEDLLDFRELPHATALKKDD